MGGAGGGASGLGCALGGGGATVPADGAAGCGLACLDAAADVPQGPVCGNSIVETGEQCDDGNTAPGDGCNGLCQIEPNYTCPVAGQHCRVDRELR